MGDIASKYFSMYTTDEADKTCGIRFENGKPYLGNTQISILNNNITVGDKEYKGTPGLWQLIIMRKPANYTEDDYNKYKEIMIKTNALRKNYELDDNRPKASRADKWKNLLKPIWDEKDRYEEGLKAVIIPSDPDALLDRLDLLLASKKAGNTGVRNEIVSISDELKRQGILYPSAYKKLMSSL